MGERFGRSGGKQLAPIAGVPMLTHVLRSFQDATTVGHVIVVCHPDRMDEYRQAAIESNGLTIPVTLAPGGDTRQLSVASGLRHTSDEYGIVAVHDGARPLVTPRTIDEAVMRILGDERVAGVVVGHPAFDTLKIVEGDTVRDTPDRSMYWIAQTPQVFRRETFKDAHSLAVEKGIQYTDDASLMEAAGGRVVMIEGPRDNFKVTVAEDRSLAEAVLRFRREGDA